MYTLIHENVWRIAIRDSGFDVVVAEKCRNVEDGVLKESKIRIFDL